MKVRSSNWTRDRWVGVKNRRWFWSAVIVTCVVTPTLVYFAYDAMTYEAIQRIEFPFYEDRGVNLVVFLKSDGPMAAGVEIGCSMVILGGELTIGMEDLNIWVSGDDSLNLLKIDAGDPEIEPNEFFSKMISCEGKTEDHLKYPVAGYGNIFSVLKFQWNGSDYFWHYENPPPNVHANLTKYVWIEPSERHDQYVSNLLTAMLLAGAIPIPTTIIATRELRDLWQH